MKPSFTLILPTYNEKDNVVKLIKDVLCLSVANRFHIMVVDDDSPDGTAETVCKSFSTNQRVRVIQRKGKVPGLVNSINEGILASETDYVMWMDADLQMPAEAIPRFVNQIDSGEFSAVIGSRYLPGGSDDRDEIDETGVVTVHKGLSWFLNQIVPVILRLPATDLTSGFIAIRRDFFRDDLLEGRHGEYFISLVAKLSGSGVRFVEIPYQLGKRIHGESKTTGGSLNGMLLSGMKYLQIVIRLYFGDRQ